MHYCNSLNLNKLVPSGTSWGLRLEDNGDSSSMGVPEGDAVGLLLQEGSIRHVRCEDDHG